VIEHPSDPSRDDYYSDYPLHEDDILSPRGGLTVADAYDSDGILIEFGEAACSMRDNYNKRLGRQIAVGRLLKRLELRETSQS
jgi:hypothetical protein